MMENVQKAVRLKEELDSLRPLKKEDEQRVMDKLRLDWNYHSNNLEGNSLTFGETKALILHGITAQGKPLRDHFEITGHNEAIKWVLDIVKEERPLTENFIRELHKLILKEPYEVDAITQDGQPTKKQVGIGEYKRTPNHVKTKTGEIFRFATPEETPAMMHDLIRWYHEKLEEKNVNPILLAAEFHYKFIRIHPFDDGNGRTARILMNFILMKFGYPPVVIKTEDKQNYISALEQADGGIFEPFVDYIAQNLVRSLEIMLKGAKGESVEEPDDIDKEINLFEQKLKKFNPNTINTKDEKAILQIYDDSISHLIALYLEKGKPFEKYYTKSTFCITINDRKTCKTGETIIKAGRKRLKACEDIKEIILSYEFESFKVDGFFEFDFFSKILFQFGNLKYCIVEDPLLNRVIFEKPYGEQLTKDDIMKIVSREIKHHIKFIEDSRK